MSNVFQRIAAVHRERFAKAEKTRLDNKKKLARRQAYFKDTGLMEMWDEVKHIKIPNPVPDVLDGLTITIGDLAVPTNTDNLENTGLVVYGKQGDFIEWAVADNSAVEETAGPKHIYYQVTMPGTKTNFCLSHENAEAKKKFVDSFIKWLSKYITPQMLVDMDIDLEAPSIVKRSRKILQLAET
jgi:hypothetical protein